MNFNKTLLFLICLTFDYIKCEYNLHLLKNDPIDVVIMLHEKDKNKVDLAIKAIKKYGKNLRRIITVSEKRLTKNAEWFDEKQFPFYKDDIANEIFPNDQKAAKDFAKSDRVGWIMKQIFNLYAAFVIPDISNNILMLDADTIFLKPVEFIDCQGNALYNPGDYVHEPYFKHAKKLISSPNEINRVLLEYDGRVHPEDCAVSHHMLFQKPVLEDLFKLIKETHKVEPWQAICRCLDKNEVYLSSMAEYEIYFNFVFARTKEVKIRKLKYKDIAFNLKLINSYKSQNYDYVACHHYI